MEDQELNEREEQLPSPQMEESEPQVPEREVPMQEDEQMVVSNGMNEDGPPAAPLLEQPPEEMRPMTSYQPGSSTQQQYNNAFQAQ